ncbi:MAG TPA: CheR family methyltransferase [Bryobacteraceae bacterium]
MAPIDFENLLRQAMGLDAGSVGSSTIERAVRSRMGATGLEQVDDYWCRLSNSAQELQNLIEAVVVPETWFFRDRPAFSVLVRLVMEERRSRRINSVLRLLSIPCSTGEEPYSIVMALLDAGLPPEQIHVDAVDISAQALARAKRATYGSNSFRGEDLNFRERYFQPYSRGSELMQWIRDKVRFHQGNLLYSEFRIADEPYDVVFCRNLLIYFDRERQEQAMRTLGRLLVDSGLLFVGPAEAFLASCSGFTSVNQAMSFAFRKNRKPQSEAAPEIRPVFVKAPKKPLPARTPSPVKADRLPLSVPPPPPAPPADLSTARSLADAGQLRKAAECCESYLRQHGPDAEPYYLLGVLRDAVGDRPAAAAYYRKVLYLEPDHLQALMHLALLIETQGDSAAAARLRERARRIEGHRKDGSS